VVFAEKRDGAVVGAQVARQPDGLQVLGASGFQPAAGAGALEVFPEVEFEQGTKASMARTGLASET
jgi:hypothetical protein